MTFCFSKPSFYPKMWYFYLLYNQPGWTSIPGFPGRSKPKAELLPLAPAATSTSETRNQELKGTPGDRSCRIRTRIRPVYRVTRRKVFLFEHQRACLRCCSSESQQRSRIKRCLSFSTSGGVSFTRRFRRFPRLEANASTTATWNGSTSR